MIGSLGHALFCKICRRRREFGPKKKKRWAFLLVVHMESELLLWIFVLICISASVLCHISRCIWRIVFLCLKYSFIHYFKLTRRKICISLVPQRVARVSKYGLDRDRILSNQDVR